MTRRTATFDLITTFATLRPRAEDAPRERPAGTVTYAFVNDIAASWEHYQLFAEALKGSIPDGLLLHAAGPTDEGFRIIAVWESEAAWDRFCTDRLAGDPKTAAHVPPVFRALRPEHLVMRGGESA